MRETLTIPDISRIASEAAERASPRLRVAGVTVGTGGGDYVEVILTIEGCRATPCRVVIGAFRNVAEHQLRAEIFEQLLRHLESHLPADA